MNELVVKYSSVKFSARFKYDIRSWVVVLSG